MRGTFLFPLRTFIHPKAAYPRKICPLQAMNAMINNIKKSRSDGCNDIQAQFPERPWQIEKKNDEKEIWPRFLTSVGITHRDVSQGEASRERKGGCNTGCILNIRIFFSDSYDVNEMHCTKWWSVLNTVFPISCCWKETSGGNSRRRLKSANVSIRCEGNANIRDSKTK